MEAKQATIHEVRKIVLPKVMNRAGNITAVNNGLELPFEVERIFYLYDIPGGESRGAHAHKLCHQFLIAASGSFSVAVDDGKEKDEHFLNQPYEGLHVPPGIWASEIDFSSGSVCLVLASEAYDETDYLRDYEQFQKFKQ